MTYVEKLRQMMEEEKFTVRGKDLNDEKVAKAIYDCQIWLKDPVNRLTSRIEGLIFLKGDYVTCTENKYDILLDKPVEPTQEEKWKIRNYKEDIEVFRSAIEMIKEQASEIKELKRRLGE